MTSSAVEATVESCAAEASALGFTCTWHDRSYGSARYRAARRAHAAPRARIGGGRGARRLPAGPRPRADLRRMWRATGALRRRSRRGGRRAPLRRARPAAARHGRRRRRNLARPAGVGAARDLRAAARARRGPRRRSSEAATGRGVERCGLDAAPPPRRRRAAGRPAGPADRRPDAAGARHLRRVCPVRVLRLAGGARLDDPTWRYTDEHGRPRLAPCRAIGFYEDDPSRWGILSWAPTDCRGSGHNQGPDWALPESTPGPPLATFGRAAAGPDRFRGPTRSAPAVRRRCGRDPGPRGPTW